MDYIRIYCVILAHAMSVMLKKIYMLITEHVFLFKIQNTNTNTRHVIMQIATEPVIK